jgi:phage-related protein
MRFIVEFFKRGGKSPVSDFILSLDEDLRLDVYAVLRRLEEDPFSLGPMSKKLEGTRNLFEVKVRGRNRAVRVFYCFKKDRTVVLLHGFVKKTDKTPRRELAIALQRMKEIQNE